MTSINIAPDTKFLNQILDSQGKKQLDIFTINRLNLAVKALSHIDPILAAAAEADVLTYTNNYTQSLKLLAKNIVKYGYTSNFLDSQLRAASHSCDWHITESIWNSYLTKYKISSLSDDLKARYIQFLGLYVISNQFDELTQTSERLERLNNLGISLENYRKLIDIILAKYSKEFHGAIQFCFTFREEDILVLLYNKYWTDEETLEITQIINDAILEVDDVNFQLEADLIQILAINCNPDRIPKDFDIYDDESEDEELFKLVSSRKSQYSSNSEEFALEV